MGNIFLVPKYRKEKIKKLISISSLSNLVKNPINWIKTNYFNLKLLFLKDISYIFIKPCLKWIDYNIKGFLHFNQAIHLYNIAKHLKNNSTIVEIGAFLGRSTCFLAEAVKKNQIKLYSIDTFENQGMSEGLRYTFNEYYRNIFPYKSYIKIIKGFSYEVVDKFENIKIDLLWLDADHSYESTIQDIQNWLPLVKKNGYFIFHDYYMKKRTSGVKKAVDEVIRMKKLKIIELVGHLCVTKKISD
ncbi:MAG: class I SAM-dependent methyltransferase [Candidatus Thorarchaeota archaeon]